MAIKVKSKLWIEIDDRPVFGSGRKMLLLAIEKHGSINRAAREMAITYRKAWGYIKAMVKRLGFPLVESKTGGRYGGGTALTPRARFLLMQFMALEAGIQEMVDAKFKNLFPDSEV